ncbi:hypothetical protein DL767_011150 [Monosporascus sp. MG133]|nr:hypothetical protein DL767_011150 [Monosporascus sp. MG133]
MWRTILPLAGKYQRFPLTAEAAAVHKALEDDGVVIIEGFLSPEQAAKSNGDVDPRLAVIRQGEKIVRLPTQVSQSPWILDLPQTCTSLLYWMADIVPPQVKRVHNLVGFSKAFRHEILNHKRMHDISGSDIWGSHKLVEMCKPDAEHPVMLSELKASDTALLSGQMVHRGSINATLDSYRRALALMVVPGILTPFGATCRLP